MCCNLHKSLFIVYVALPKADYLLSNNFVMAKLEVIVLSKRAVIVSEHVIAFKTKIVSFDMM